ncbi:MAG: Ig-like domain-containing protein [Kiritimatiellae bacterium]|nr:Ig-like domain-containing protein [Kiritimatiellia bacterium]
MRTLKRLVIGLTVAVTSFLQADEIAPKLRIMPLGDSITYCVSVAGGYRLPLYTLLTNAGYSIDYVGTQTGNSSADLPDIDHEGHSGWRITHASSGIYENILGWLDKIDAPDVILLHLGTNDSGESDFSNRIDKMGLLLDRIASIRPAAHIILTTILTRTDNDTRNTAIQTYFNPYVEDLVAAHQAKGQRVHFLDMDALCPAADTLSSDGLHPGANGYQLMANAWYPAITNIFASSYGDNLPPMISHAVPVADRKGVTVYFNKPVKMSTANQIAKYSVTDNSVTATEVSSDQRSVTLTLAEPLSANVTYTVTASDITDLTTPAHTGSSSSRFVAYQYGYRNNVPQDEYGKYSLVYDLNIPANGPWGSNRIENRYDINNSANMPTGFNRVAYYLELKAPGGKIQWVWVSMDTFTDDISKISVPTFASGAVFQQKVTGMNVFCNVDGVTTGTEIDTGNIEFWPWNYNEQISGNGLGGSGSVYDFDDTCSTGGDYGSMQIHNWASKETIFAYNHWNDANGACCLGIGNDPNFGNGNIGADWTFDGNGASYEVRRLQVFVSYPPDTTPPTIASVKAGAAGTQVFVKFSETIQASSLSGATFASDAFTVLNAELMDDGMTVKLTTTAFDANASDITLTVNGIFDAAANMIAADTAAEVAAYGLPDVIAANIGANAEGYELVYITDIPEYSSYNSDPKAYWFDQSSKTGEFDRVAYYLELQPLNGAKRYVWTSFDAFTQNREQLGIPTAAKGSYFQQKVSNMFVASNYGNAKAGTYPTGCNIEFWPCNYDKAVELNVPNGAANMYDIDDALGTGNTPLARGHGSMQVHNHSASNVIWAISNFGNDDRSNRISIGIGNGSVNGRTDTMDWTFAYNANIYATRRLYVLVHPAKRYDGITAETVKAEVAEKIGANTLEGYETLFAISQFPNPASVGTPDWRANHLYTVDRRDELSKFGASRIAYYMELKKPSDSESKYVWTAMDPFTTDFQQYGVPVGGYTFQQQVGNLDVKSNVAGIVNGDGIETGCIEFWASNYAQGNKQGTWGGDASLFDWDDTNYNTSANGHGSMQVHNYGANQVLWSIVSFNNNRAAGIGIGNNPNYSAQNDLDWTHQANIGDYTVAKLYAFVKPAADSLENTIRNEVAAKIGAERLENFELLFAVTNVPNNCSIANYIWARDNFYAIDNRTNYRQGEISRIAYYVETRNTGDSVSSYVWTAMDAFTDVGLKFGVPMGGYYIQQQVTNLDVLSNVSSITSGDGIETGCIEFWATNYGNGNTQNNWNGTAGYFDWDDAGYGTGCNGYGAMQVHNYGAKQVLWAFNHFNGGNVPSVGIGNNPNYASQKDLDWTFTNNRGSLDIAKIYAFVITGPHDSTAMDISISKVIASIDGDKLAVKFNSVSYEALEKAVITLNNGATVKSFELRDSQWAIINTSALTAGGTYELTIDGLLRDDATAQPAITANITVPTVAAATLPEYITAIPEVSGYRLLQRLDIPANSSTIYENTAYTVDEGYFSHLPFDRIAYCLDIVGTDGVRKWVYASMDAFCADTTKIGLPTYDRGAIYQQRVDNLNVYASENTGVTTGTGITTGNIEFWPQSYQTPATMPELNGNTSIFDFDDKRDDYLSRGYGCMQVHNFGAKETLLAINRFGNNNQNVIAGVGNCPNSDLTGNSAVGTDWTHDESACSFNSRTLYVLVRDVTGPVASGNGPAISTQPQDVTCRRNDKAVFGVLAAGAISFQWFRDGIIIDGANGSSLVLDNVGVGDAGEYNVLVQGADGTTLSDTATLTYIADGTLIIFK